MFLLVPENSNRQILGDEIDLIAQPNDLLVLRDRLLAALVLGLLEGGQSWAWSSGMSIGIFAGASTTAWVLTKVSPTASSPNDPSEIDMTVTDSSVVER